MLLVRHIGAMVDKPSVPVWSRHELAQQRRLILSLSKTGYVSLMVVISVHFDSSMFVLHLIVLCRFAKLLTVYFPLVQN